ncbi:F0F1 ATP synthase subunit A [Nocardioides limicola]|uniref:F0F1 ATP synthase subunit A n=1 Tax=Nocardioides limicola TaxID=2803368 RepID=UPI0027DC45C1|nr:F0F1 ATP synthase subunit A [Nocardioides sp. DJM-14]
MSVTASMAAATIKAAGGSGFHAPGPEIFNLPPVFGEVTKPMLLLCLSAVLIIAFTVLSSRPAAVVPGRLQFAGEAVYGFVRNSIARENIGSAHFMRFVPYLFALFLFILVNNYYALIPLLQFPSFSRIGFIVPLAAISWLLYIGAGMWKHGPLGYLKHATVPAGVPLWITPVLVPLEFLSNIIVRPATLTLRLFGNMFAGHILLVLFATGGWYLLGTGNFVYAGAGVLAFVLGIAVSFLEVIVMFLQAYVFTLLSSMYIGEALADEH